jgi:hypothetical protein
VAAHEEIIQQARADYQTAAADLMDDQRILVRDKVALDMEPAGWWIEAIVWVSAERLDGGGSSALRSRFCRLCGADLDGNNPHGPTCPHRVTA